MGQLFGDFCNRPLINSIYPTDLYYLHAQASWQSEHTNDVYTNAGELRVGCQSSSETGKGRLECVGSVRGHGLFTRYIAGNGHRFRAAG